MAEILSTSKRPTLKLFHNEWVNVYPEVLPLDNIHYWKENNRTIFTFEKLVKEKGKDLKYIPIEEITRYVAEQDVHKLQVLADSIERNGVQVPLTIRDDGKLLDGNRRYFACQWLKMKCLEKRKPLPDALLNIPVQIIRKADLAIEPTLELKILAEANFIADLKVPWPLDAQARAVREYFLRVKKEKKIGDDEAIEEVVGVFGIKPQRARDFLGALELTDKFIDGGKGDKEITKRRSIVEDRFVYFWEFMNKATKGRGAYDPEAERAELKDAKEMFFDLMAKGKDSPVVNVKQIEPLAQSRRNAMAWGILKESKGASLSTVIAIINDKKETRRAEDKVRIFISWLKDLSVVTPKTKTYLREVIELAEQKVTEK